MRSRSASRCAGRLAGGSVTSLCFVGEQFHFDPDTYLDLITAEVPGYLRLQDAVARAIMGLTVGRVLELGAGTGVTTQRIASGYPEAKIVGVDESTAMLEHARRSVPQADLRVGRLEQALPAGPFDLAVSALAVHHLDGPGKADLFTRIAAVPVSYTHLTLPTILRV